MEQHINFADIATAIMDSLKTDAHGVMTAVLSFKGKTYALVEYSSYTRSWVVKSDELVTMFSSPKLSECAEFIGRRWW